MNNDNSLESEEFFLRLTITEIHRENFKRLDQFLASEIPSMTRNEIQRLFHDEAITSSAKLSLSKMPPVGTLIEIEIPELKDSEAKAEDIPLDILYQDDDVIFLNKKAGMVVHPAPGHYSGTLVNALLFLCPHLKGIGGVKRPGIVHRLDQGTSGVMVVAKNEQAHRTLVETFQKHDLERHYQCISLGKNLPSSGVLKSTIGRHPTNRLKMHVNVPLGKEAITYFKVIQSWEKFHHMELKLETGRTHQIRVHLTELLKAPILMDKLYSNPPQHLSQLPPSCAEILKNYPYPLLHARSLKIQHPCTHKTMHFEVPPPPIFTQTLKGLNLC